MKKKGGGTSYKDLAVRGKGPSSVPGIMPQVQGFSMSYTERLHTDFSHVE